MASTRAVFELGSVTNPQDSEAYRFKYDQDKTPASMAVVTALSEAMDVDPIELEPLHEAVDTDALVCVRGTMNGDVHERTDGQRKGITQK